ncbi:hypothetical protein AVEN_211660-1 [Araneus ventricosus]|uniref:Uncharacterized protein n=1 Tax=Araneus ventricosus TaxID=182803 RepID=A0A4Y2M4J7_ARAVE|nr:hypothetical protein AVEN_211660-1 [Araneus ventricosus]
MTRTTPEMALRPTNFRTIPAPPPSSNVLPLVWCNTPHPDSAYPTGFKALKSRKGMGILAEPPFSSCSLTLCDASLRSNREVAAGLPSNASALTLVNGIESAAKIPSFEIITMVKGPRNAQRRLGEEQQRTAGCTACPAEWWTPHALPGR